MPDHEPVPDVSVERWLGRRGHDGEAGVSNADLLGAIRDLREEIRSLWATPGVATAARLETLADVRESLAARVEIAQMVRMIGRAKAEIAAIKHPKAQDDRMLAAAGELDAIVLATETSTEDILGAAESIASLIRKIAGRHRDDRELATLAERIADEITKIFVACNFQDITGQRITKVVKTLRFIEERILAMVDIWGIEAFAELPLPEPTEGDGGEALMNGPPRGPQGISQEDINALFD